MPARIRKIHDAAVTLFLRQGYARTKIAHIAQAVGVSVGTIYYDFDGKEEIRDFVLKCTIHPEFIDGALPRPINKELFTGLEDEIIAAFDQTAASFAAHLEDGAEGYRFADLISDAFDLMAQYAVGCLFIEKNMDVCGKLGTYYMAYRQRFFGSMERYLSILLERGALRPLEDVGLVASLVIEMLSWWAMDMRYISFAARPVPLEAAKAVCLDNLLHAYEA